MIYLKKIANKKLKGFTLVEVLVTLVLTTLAITYAYTTLNYIQQLYSSYKLQNKFITEYCNLKQKLYYESLCAEKIVVIDESRFLFEHDSTMAELIILQNKLLLKKLNYCDTFHFEVKKIKSNYETMVNPNYQNKLVNKLSFETEFVKQTFNFYFYKNYDAATKLKLNETSD